MRCLVCRCCAPIYCIPKQGKRTLQLETSQSLGLSNIDCRPFSSKQVLHLFSIDKNFMSSVFDTNCQKSSMSYRKKDQNYHICE